MDGGLGNNYRVIYGCYAELQSRSVFGRGLVMSPDPRLMESLREADPDTYGARGAAATAGATTGDRAMKKDKIARAVARETDVTYLQALAVVDTLTTLVIETVVRGERVTLRDLGYFDSREWKGRTVKKILGDAFSIPSHGVPTFHPGSKSRKAVRQ